MKRESERDTAETETETETEMSERAFVCRDACHERVMLRTSSSRQVKQSVAASLRNLRTDYLDCLLLHSPLPSHEQTLRAWRQMEAHVAAGEARALGLSNQYDAAALERLCEEASR